MTTDKKPKYLYTPHKCRVENCKGRLVDPPETYSKWAYWWGLPHRGWRNKPQPEEGK